VMMGLGFVGMYFMPNPSFTAPLAFLTGFGTYLVHNTLQTHGSQMAPKMRGTAMALFAFCFFIGQAGGVSAAGWAYDHVGPALLLLLPAVMLPLNAWNFARGLNRRARAGA
jgi:predicted MFS family arabinose efflux permease